MITAAAAAAAAAADATAAFSIATATAAGVGAAATTKASHCGIPAHKCRGRHPPTANASANTDDASNAFVTSFIANSLVEGPQHSADVR